MYISKILLNAAIPLVRNELANLDLLDKTLSKLSGTKKFRYRLETVPLDKNGYMQPLVLVSENKPDPALSGKPSGFFAAVETFKYAIPVKNGMVYKFFLKANPSAKILFFDSEFEGNELQIKWLESESYSNGFQLIDCSVKNDGYITASEKKVKILSAVFEGSMKVTDESRFKKMLYVGLGRGKEFGLGLVSVESYGCKNRNIAEEMKANAEKSQSK